MPEGEIELPKFYNTVKTLDQVMDVDYYLPGCPPQDPQIWAVIEAIVSGQAAAEGQRDRRDREDGVRRVQACARGEADQAVPPLPRDHRRLDAVPLRPGHHLLGAGDARRLRRALPQVDIPCRGCYGPPPHIHDQGAALLSAVASVVDADTEEEARRIVGEIPDPIGTFYRFSLPASMLHRAKVGNKGLGTRN